jgi:hypothetical protein
MDNANRHIGEWSFRPWQKLSSLLWRISLPGKEHQIAAGWYGNDTTWRMVLDLNRIVKFGKSDGTLADKPQRQLFSLCDGIIGGQGDGPLKPEPLPLGIISFTDYSAANDIAMATLMDFETDQIPMLKAALKDNKDFMIFYNDKAVELEALKNYAIHSLPPPGWLSIFKKTKQ